jgi:hypothetical protein
LLQEYILSSFFFGGFPENGPEELMFGCICGNPKSLANPGEATGLFITIKKKYVSININMINLIYVYLFVYVLVCTYQLRKTYLDADGCSDIEMVSGGGGGGGPAKLNSLATWSSSTLVFITIQHIKYVSVNINKINFIICI